MQYTLVSNEDGSESNITVFIPGRSPLIAHSSHANFEDIVRALALENADADEIEELFDLSVGIGRRFEKLTERVSVSNGQVYFDGDEVHSSLTEAILRFLDDGEDNWGPLVKFFENVQANPNEHSRKQLYDWLAAHNLTLTESGFVVAYKGVIKRSDDSLQSCHKGRAIVNGEVKEGNIPNDIGYLVEMPRSEVHHDQSTPCSTGLHVGTYGYAQSWARGAMLEVHVNPRDVVSVPSDGRGEKVRVCRYFVSRVIDAPRTEALISDDDSWYDDVDEPEDWGW